MDSVPFVYHQRPWYKGVTVRCWLLLHTATLFKNNFDYGSIGVEDKYSHTPQVGFAFLRPVAMQIDPDVFPAKPTIVVDFRAYTHIYVHIYIHTYTHTDIHSDTHTYVHTYTHIHIYIYVETWDSLECHTRVCDIRSHFW